MRYWGNIRNWKTWEEMQQSNKIERSELWKQIYKVVKQIPIKEVNDDSVDLPSVTTELEELFLKLLSTEHVKYDSLSDNFKRIIDNIEDNLNK